MTNKLVLIDGNSMINRAYYATPLLTNKDGVYTNAVFGFVNMLVKIILENEPKYIAVAFDVKQPTFRHEMYAEYKAGRKAMPEELRVQVDVLKQTLKVMGIRCLEQPGIEADDILGTLSKRFPVNTVIVTGDRDALQLVDDSSVVWLTKKGLSEIQEVTPKNIEELFGVTPQGVVDLKSLMGDSSDNIPGVAGVGEKTALTLLKEYKNLDGVYAHLEEIKGKLREKLEQSRESAYLSYELATIKTDAALACDIEECVYQFPFSPEVYENFKKLGFNSLTKREALFGEETKTRSSLAEKVAVTSGQQLIGVLAKFDKERPVAVEFAKNLHLAQETEREFVVSLQDNFLEAGIPVEEAMEAMRSFLEDASARKLVYDAKALTHMLDGYGIRFAGADEDAAVAAYVCGYGNLSGLADLLSKRGWSGDAFASGMLAVQAELMSEIERMGTKELYQLEKSVSRILYGMEVAGFRIDRDILDSLGKKFTDELAELTEKIYELAGERFNINSPKQLSALLFEKLQLKSQKKTKTGYSTDNEVLENLSDQHEIIPLLIKYRQLSKLNGTYIEGFRSLLDAEGRVHTEFKQMLTTTGRLSSTDPNLQNIPVRDGVGKEIRRMFVPSQPDGYLVTADYSQIELRLLAHLSQDETLIAAYNGDADIHTGTAMLIFGVSRELVTPNMRRAAKAINFGIIYGKGDFSLAKDLGITRKAAREYIDRYFATYPKVREYLDSSVEFARKNGYVKTILGRIRKINEITSSNFNTRSYGERAAMNMPLQGSAADIIKLAMVNVSKKLNELHTESKLILQVHDELIVDATKEERDMVVKLLRGEMENVMKLSVPLVVDVGYAQNWFEAK